MSRTVAEAQRAAVQALTAAGIADAAGDARHLLAHAMGISRDRLILIGADPVPADAMLQLAQALARRIAREPVARIIGRRLFWGRDFAVTPDVLDPRGDTETLIATALEGPPPARLLDLGTGSGAIAVTLLAEWPRAHGVATDISAAALAVAGQNAQNLGVADRLELVLTDWCADLTGPFDLILSNPPYISAQEMAGLEPEVLHHDPALALSPGGDGLGAYRQIAQQTARVLAPQGRVIVEIGWQQGQDVLEIFRKTGWQDQRLIADLAGLDRVVVARNPAQQAEITRNDR
ncbi:peptide chain release factor N(5)-glutamine methyltransferase [Seohaeicola saemankumensis]|uniref:peptide chain release factor N(5)-glutamine methyltransferase n=1 Tax=Seohaeicola saemankumensis TaxID=481181 RepID=UPI001E387ECF|nr:peptide chain release factor N(5)-glutamine methyltransferase [Seohaeicola saemankumensis]MCD1624610.1 peptide chain release factor N(5)-glutamine methyltransferase [Seohaeicola saemankumensis]